MTSHALSEDGATNIVVVTTLHKAQLFLEAARHYKKLYWSPAWDRLAANPDIHEGMAAFFQEAAGILTSQDAPCGCLIILAATNVSAEGQAINDTLKELREEGLDCFLTRIKRAIVDGQLPPDTNTPAMAVAANTMLDGMSLRARDGVSRSELEQVGAIAMSMFRKELLGAAGSVGGKAHGKPGRQ